jgi:steroid 5-alpha reductase family enzyme
MSVDTVAILVALVAAPSLIMALAWAVQRRLGNAGWVDSIWSLGVGATGAVLALAYGVGPRRFLVAAAIALWSLRLALHLALRTAKGPEDVRYASFRREWGDSFERRMFWFLQIQAGAAALLALSVLAAARNPAPSGIGDLLGIALTAIAILGEAVADAQLQRFRNLNRGRICTDGLWSLSRHPNYFFEWLGWLAYPAFAIDTSGGYLFGWLAFVGPALMYVLLVHVSGIPPLERQMLQSRGQAYRDYQHRTSPFVPWPRRAA